MKIDGSRPLVLGIALALGTHAAAAGEKPAEKDAPVVRQEVEVKKNEAKVVKTDVKPKDEAELEARLEAARERLEQAAREVAELSGQLTGPMMHDGPFMIGRPRAVLGINIDDTSSKEGVPIESVSPNGPASNAGLKGGDVIVSLDGMKLAGNEDPPAKTLIRHMRTVEPGSKVKVEYLRDGKKLRTEVVTEELRSHRWAVPAMPAMPAVPAVPAVPATEYRFHGMMDMELVTLTPKLGSYFGADKGVLVVRAPKDSQFKLEEGDVIVDIGGRQPQSGTHALRILRSYQPGEKVTMNVLRNRKKVQLDATVPKNERTSRVMPMPDAKWLADVTFEAAEAALESPAAPSVAAPAVDDR